MCSACPYPIRSSLAALHRRRPLGHAAKSREAVGKAGGTSLGSSEKDGAESEASGRSPRRASIVIEQGVYFRVEQPFRSCGSEARPCWQPSRIAARSGGKKALNLIHQ